MRGMIAFVAMGVASTASIAAAPLPAIVGAWRLVEIDEAGADGRTIRHTDLKGSLIYTAGGEMSVQVSYPSADVNNEYVRDGYEASFGRFDADERTHRLVHHVEGANVPALVGRDLPRTFSIEGRRLIVGPVAKSERWSVVWERR